jgi:hypothetical protein
MESNIETVVKLVSEATEQARAAYVFFTGGFRKLGLEVAGEAHELASKAYEESLALLGAVDTSKVSEVAYAAVWADALKRAISAQKMEYSYNV